MTDLELLRDCIVNNLDSISSGSRENAISILKSFCEENSVPGYQEARELHYYMYEGEDPDNWLDLAVCKGTGGAHSFVEVYVAPTYTEKGFTVYACSKGGDALYYKETPVVKEGDLDKSEFFCNQIILEDESDFICSLSEEISDVPIEEDLSPLENDLDITYTETIIETTNPVTNTNTNKMPFICVGVLLALFISCICIYLNQRKSNV